MEPSSSTSNQPLALRRHKKSRYGCRACKQRHVKCDEKKPICGQCERHFSGIVACDWDTLPEPSTLQSSKVTKRRPGTRASGSRRGTSTPMSQPSSILDTRTDLFDPFDTLVFPESLPNEDMLPFYRSTLVSKMFPFLGNTAMIDAWCNLMHTDPLLTQIALSTTAIQLERRQGRANHYRSTELTFSCVNLLQQKISDEAEASSDLTLIAISQLIALENDTGNTRTVRLHTQALQDMIRLRGGLEAIAASSRIAPSMIFWSTMVASTEPSSLPCRFEDLDTAPTWFRSTHDVPEMDLSRYGIDSGLSSWMQSTSELYHQMTILPTFTDPLQGFAIVFEICRSIQRLVEFELPTPVDRPMQWFLSDSSRQAAALYILFPTQTHFPCPQLFLNALLQGLKRSLIQTLEFFNPQEDNSLLIWLLCVGCVASWHLQERRWFVEHLGLVLEYTDIRSEEELRTRLSNIMEFPTFMEFNTLRVWAKVNESLSKA